MGLAARSLALIAIGTSLAHADDRATSPARPDYEASEKLLMWKGRHDLEHRGVTIDGTYASELFFAPDLNDRLVLAGLFTTELDVELDKLISKRLGRLHVSAFAIHGKGITSELMDVHGTSGNTADNEVRLFEAWIDQPLGPVTLRAGLLSADQELLLADQAQTLLGATFGITSQFSANLLGPVYPVATPGVSARFESELLDVRAAIYDGEQESSHGIPTAAGDSVLAIGEIEYATAFMIGAWHHGERGNAIYAVVDTEVTKGLGVFARAGHSDAGFVSTYIDAGVRATPSSWRPEDLLSLGMAFARTERGAETAVEMTYEAQVRWLTIQPDVQIMLLPERTVVMFATRLTIAL